MSPQLNTSPTGLDIALFLQREKRRLPERAHEFVEDMVKHLSGSRRSSVHQARYLYALFHRLGGKIT